MVIVVVTNPNSALWKDIPEKHHTFASSLIPSQWVPSVLTPDPPVHGTQPPAPAHLFPVNAMQDTELLANATEILSEILEDATVVGEVNQ